MRYDISFLVGFLFSLCILFMSCISSHSIIRIASALVAVIVFFNLHPLVVVASPLLLLTIPRPTLFFHFPSCLNRSLFAHRIDPSPVSETPPDPNRTIVTVGSGSFPNIYKTSPFSYLDSLAYFSVCPITITGTREPLT